MKPALLRSGLSLVLLAASLSACRDTTETAPVVTASPTPSATPTPTPTALASSLPVTWPLLDAFFFNDDSFARELQQAVQLTEDQLAQVRHKARLETTRLDENAAREDEEYLGSTTTATSLTRQQLSDLLGADKAAQVSSFVWRRWQMNGLAAIPTATPAAGTTDLTPPATPTPTPAITETGSSLVPADTRLIVNAPAYRLDVFQNGQLLKSYRIGIGYPEFPLPSGLRQATSIIFNPTWTPPDEPWVESSKQVKVGEKVPAGSSLNPLGVIKIPIGMPSLIHGGKSAAKLGGFASHGCVGLTDAQVQDLAKTLAELGGVTLSEAEIKQYAQKRTETKNFKLTQPIPVELHYETVMVIDGRLHIFRDVYEHGLNTPEHVHEVLAGYGISFDKLSETEQKAIAKALEQMSRNAAGQPIPAASHAGEVAPTATPTPAAKSARITRTIKGPKVIVVEIAALAGKGYPAPIGIEPEPTPTPAATARAKRRK